MVGTALSHPRCWGVASTDGNLWSVPCCVGTHSNKRAGKYLESKHPERQIPQDTSVTTSVTVLVSCSEPAPAPVAFLCSQTRFGVYVGVSSLFLLLRGGTGLGTEKGEGALLGVTGSKCPVPCCSPPLPRPAV